MKLIKLKDMVGNVKAQSGDDFSMISDKQLKAFSQALLLSINEEIKKTENESVRIMGFGTFKSHEPKARSDGTLTSKRILFRPSEKN